MQVRKRPLFALTAVLAATGSAVLVARDSSPAGAGAGCGTGTLQGVYVMYGGGTLFGAPSAVVGTVTFDGAGALDGSHVDSTGGLITRSTLGGTYAVDGGCRGTATFTHHHAPQNGEASVGEVLDDHVFELAVAGGGARAYWLLTQTVPDGAGAAPPAPDPDVVVSGWFERA